MSVITSSLAGFCFGEIKMCVDYTVLNGVFSIGQSVKIINPLRGWFDFSMKKEIPAGTIGSIFKIEKLSDSLNEVEYTVKFEKEFDFVKIKHKDLNNV